MRSRIRVGLRMCCLGMFAHSANSEAMEWHSVDDRRKPRHDGRVKFFDDLDSLSVLYDEHTGAAHYLSTSKRTRRETPQYGQTARGKRCFNLARMRKVCWLLASPSFVCDKFRISVLHCHYKVHLKDKN